MILKQRRTSNSSQSIAQTALGDATANAFTKPECEKTPLANRGLNSQVDYLRITFKYISTNTFSEIITLIFKTFADTPKMDVGKGRVMGKYYANTGHGVKNILLGWNESGEQSQSPFGELLVVISGASFANVAQKDVSAMLHELEKYKPKYTRIDVAIDDFNKQISYETMLAALENRQYTGFNKFLPIKPGDSKGSNLGFTIYLGSRKSDITVRYYDKEVESKGLIKAYRLEGEFKNEKAQAVVNEYLSIPSDQYEELAAMTLAGAVTGKLAFVEKSSKAGHKNVSRRKRLDWWETFVDRVGAEIKLGIHRIDPTLQATSNWVKKQVAPTLAVLRRVLGTLDFRAFLDNLIDQKDQYLSEANEAKIQVWMQSKHQVFGHITRKPSPFTSKKHHPSPKSRSKSINDDEYSPVYPAGTVVRHLIDGITRKVIASTHTHAQLEGLPKAVSVYLLQPAT